MYFLDAIASLQDRDGCKGSQMLFEHLDIILKYLYSKGHRCILNILGTIENTARQWSQMFSENMGSE